MGKRIPQALSHICIFTTISHITGEVVSIESQPHYYLACVLPTALHKNARKKCQYQHARVRSPPAWPNPFFFWHLRGLSRKNFEYFNPIRYYNNGNFNKLDYVYRHYLYIPLIIPEKTIRLSGVCGLEVLFTHLPRFLRTRDCNWGRRCPWDMQIAIIQRETERGRERPNGIERAGKLSLRCPHTEHTESRKWSWGIR